MGSKSFHLIGSAILGIVFGILGEFLYPVFTQKLWQPFGIALYFLALVLFLSVGIMILASLRDDIVFWSNNKKIGKYDELKLSAVLVCIFFVASLGLEFIYELGGKIVTQDPTSYVFLIDDSGSMSANDPDNIRATAINNIMDEEDANLPYAVYSFTDHANMLKDISLYSPSDRYEFSYSGGTDIVNSLSEVVSQIVNSTSPMYGAAPKILLLSDGESSSRGINSVIKTCNDNNIAVSTVSFGSFFENALLRKIAYQTGGEFLKIEAAENLNEGMKQAILSTAKRNLISDRYVKEYDGLYLAMRILFLAIMGFIWSLIKANVCFARDKYGYQKVLRYSLLFCTIAAVAVEVMYKAGVFSQQIIHLILCVLWALTPVEVYLRKTGGHKPIVPVRTSVSEFNESNFKKNVEEKPEEDTVKKLIK